MGSVSNDYGIRGSLFVNSVRNSLSHRLTNIANSSRGRSIAYYRGLWGIANYLSSHWLSIEGILIHNLVNNGVRSKKPIYWSHRVSQHGVGFQGAIRFGSISSNLIDIINGDASGWCPKWSSKCNALGVCFWCLIFLASIEEAKNSKTKISNKLFYFI